MWHAVAAAALVLLLVAGPAAAEPGPPLELEPTAPENLRCSGPGLVPEPPPVPPDWTPAHPIWEWQDFARFENDPGYTSPIAVALDRQCTVYVADALRSQVVRYAWDGSEMWRWTMPTLPAHAVPEPVPGSLMGVAVDAQDNVYASDYARNMMHKFTADGRVETWGLCLTPAPENNFCDPSQLVPGGPALFVGPTTITVDGQGNVYVADGSRILKLNAEGHVLEVWQLPADMLYIQGGMATDRAGNLYMADGFNDLIWKFDSNGAVVAQFGGSGQEPGQLRIARGVAVDLDGNIYTSDQDNWRVQKLWPDGAFAGVQWRNCLIGTVDDCQIPANGDQPGQFFDHHGLVIDGQGTLYVADKGNNRVQRLVIVGYTDPVPPPPEEEAAEGT